MGEMECQNRWQIECHMDLDMMPGGMAERMPHRIADRMPNGMSDRMPATT